MAENIIHEILPVGLLQCNCSVVGDPQTREAIVLDPGDEVERILEIIARHKLTVPVLMHPDDLELYRRLDTQAAWLGMEAPARVEVDELLREGDAVRWGGYQARVMHTPGHTRGSVCLYLPADAHLESGEQPARLFAGDTLFAGSIGRTDLPGGSFDLIMRSIHSKLLALPDDTLVYPGHRGRGCCGNRPHAGPPAPWRS